MTAGRAELSLLMEREMDKDMAMPTARAATADAAEPVVSGEAGIPIASDLENCLKLYDYPRSMWGRFTNYGLLELPKAKFASEPYVFIGGEPPRLSCPISTWCKGDKQLSGYWVPSGRLARHKWKPGLVFRLRDYHRSAPVPLVNNTSVLERIAIALERIAQGTEARRAATTGAVYDGPVRKDAPGDHSTLYGAEPDKDGEG